MCRAGVVFTYNVFSRWQKSLTKNYTWYYIKHYIEYYIRYYIRTTIAWLFTATKTQVDYPGAYGRWSRFMRISRSAWNAIFGNLLGTIEFILEAYRKFVYAINHKFANVSKHLLNRDKHSLIWLFVFDVRELLMVAIAECEKPNRRKAMLHIAAIYQTYNYRFSMIDYYRFFSSLNTPFYPFNTSSIFSNNRMFFI